MAEAPSIAKNRSTLKRIAAAFAVLAAATLIAIAFRSGSNASAVDAALCYEGALGEQIDVAGGRFAKGSAHHYPEERPAIEVDVTAFQIDAHEVTNIQFEAFVDATGYLTSAETATNLGFDEDGSAVFAGGFWRFVAGANWRRPEGPGSSIDGRSREPVVHVSRADAEAYAEWAGRRLPTEAEFEYIAKLGAADAADGDSPGPPRDANTWQGVFPAVDTADDGFAGRAPVGCFAPNALGAYDMIGNVWEWTSDPYFPTQNPPIEMQEVQSAGFDPRQPNIPVGVLKGGSYLCAENFCRRYRPAARHPQDIAMGSNHIGFRTARSIDAPTDG